MRTDLPDPATATHIALAAVIMLSAGTALQSQAADGLQWSIQPERVGNGAEAYWRLAYGNGRLVAVSAALSNHGTYLWDESGAWNRERSIGAFDVAFGNGLFVALADELPPVAIYSEDGDYWDSSVDYITYPAFATVHGRGRFVTGGGGYLATSELGKEWETFAGGLAHDPYALAFGKGKFVALTQFDRLQTSVNLTEWSSTYVQGRGFLLRTVTFGRGLLVAAGEGGQDSDGEVVVTSLDAMTWTAHEYAHNEAPRRGLCYGNGLFAGGGPDGTLYTSRDGVNWAVTKLDASSEFEDVVFADGRFAAVARDGTFALSEQVPPEVEVIQFRLQDSFRLPDGAMLLTVEGPYGKPVVVEASEDMVNWEEIATDPCDRGEFEVYDEAAADLPHRFYRAVEWEPPPPPDDPLLNWGVADTVLQEGQFLSWKLAYGNGVFVAAGKKNDNSGSAWYSEDGLTWHSSNSSKPHENLAFGAGRFVSTAGATPMSTINGQEWAEYDPLGVVAEGQMVFGRGRFSCVAPAPRDDKGNRRTWFLSSADAAHWMTNMVPLLPVETQGVYGQVVAYAKGRMVFLDLWKIVSSADGKDWDVGVQNLPQPEWARRTLHALVYGKGQFVAGGYDNVWPTNPDDLYTSEDGITWTWHRPEGVVPEKWIYANGTFLAESWSSSKAVSHLYGSADGLTWTNLVEVETGGTPSDLLFAEGRFYLVTWEGEVWRSDVMPPHVTDPRVIPELTYRLPDGAMLVTVEAPYGNEVVVEGSEDLETWQEIGRDPCDRGEFEIYHETAPPGTDWFYRARQVEP